MANKSLGARAVGNVVMSVWEGTSKEGEFRVQQRSPVQLEIHMKLWAKHMDQCVVDEYRQLASRTQLPGFRKGKVPLALLRKRYGGSLESEVAQKQLQSVYVQAMQKADASPVQDAQMQQPLAYTQGQDISCVVHVQVKPHIQLAKWQGLHVRVPEFVVGKQHVDNALQQLRQRFSVLAPIAPRKTIIKGDVVRCCMRAQVNGKPVAALQQDDVEIHVGTHSAFPEIHQALVDRKVGEAFEVQLTLPDNFADAALQGKPAVFHMEVRDAKQRQLPAVDNEFAKDVLTKGETVQQLQEQIELGLQDHKRKLQQQHCKQEIVDALLKLHDVELPDALVKTCFDNLLRQAAAQIGVQPDVLQQKADKSMQQEFKERAQRLVKKDLILEAIAKQEHVEVSEQELKQEVTQLASQVSAKQAQDFVKRLDLHAVREVVRQEKTLQLVMQKAKVDRFEKPLPIDSEPAGVNG
ncbi:MAG: trigger factor [Myxococcota bacterium]